jgi:indolepyruvate decarboxylase
MPGDFALSLLDRHRAIRRAPALHPQPRARGGLRGRRRDPFHGGLGVAAITSGAGAFDLVNPIAGAHAERSPVVVLSGAQSRAEPG